MRQWIMNADDEGQTYIIRVDFQGELRGWVAGKLDTVLDLITDQQIAERDGEDSDTLTVSVLTAAGPLPCRIKSKAHRQIGFIEHRVCWRDPFTSGRSPESEWPSESGYTRFTEA